MIVEETSTIHLPIIPRYGMIVPPFWLLLKKKGSNASTRYYLSRKIIWKFGLNYFQESWSITKRQSLLKSGFKILRTTHSMDIQIAGTFLLVLLYSSARPIHIRRSGNHWAVKLPAHGLRLKQSLQEILKKNSHTEGCFAFWTRRKVFWVLGKHSSAHSSWKQSLK